MSGIRISKKHGVNPSIVKCFWCGKERNEIALLGRLPDDAEAPRCVCIDYEPCDECKRIWSQGVAIIEVVEHGNNPPIQERARPTGAYLVVRHGALPNLDDGVRVMLAREEDFKDLKSRIVGKEEV